MAAPQHNGHRPPPLTPEPPRLTRIRRNLAKVLVIALFSALLAIVLVRALSHPHETAAERRQREQLEAEARQPNASADALRKRLEGQHSPHWPARQAPPQRPAHHWVAHRSTASRKARLATTPAHCPVVIARPDRSHQQAMQTGSRCNARSKRCRASRL